MPSPASSQVTLTGNTTLLRTRRSTCRCLAQPSLLRACLTMLLLIPVSLSFFCPFFLSEERAPLDFDGPVSTNCWPLTNHPQGGTASKAFVTRGVTGAMSTAPGLASAPRPILARSWQMLLCGSNLVARVMELATPQPSAMIRSADWPTRTSRAQRLGPGTRHTLRCC